MVTIACREKRLGRAFRVVQLLQEVLGQQLGVAVALAQRRQRDRKHREAIHQVFAQLAVLHRLPRIAIGGRDDAHARAQLFLAADARVAAGFEHAQQAHLHFRRHLGDFVEEQRAAFGALEAAAVLRAAPVNAPFS